MVPEAPEVIEMRVVCIVIVGLVTAIALSVVLQALLPWALTALIAAIPLVVLRHGWGRMWLAS